MVIPTNPIYQKFINLHKKFGNDPTKYEFSFASMFDLFDIVVTILRNQFNSNYTLTSDVFRNYYISLDGIAVFQTKHGELQQLWNFYESEVLRNKLMILRDSF